LTEVAGLPPGAPPRHQAIRLEPWQLALGLAFVLVAALAALAVGPADLSLATVLDALGAHLPLVHLGHRPDATALAIVWQLRLPRVVLGLLVGAMLSLAGASYQGVFQNPLADPYLLGVAAGAGLGATAAIVLLPAQWHNVALPPAAFAGAVVSVIATFTLGRTGGARNRSSLILAGVAVASFFVAAQTFLQQRDSPALADVYSWILGGLATAGWSQVLLALPYLVLSAVALLSCRHLLDVLSVGDEEAESLGVRAARVRAVVIVAATLGTAAAVAVSGLIGFVGIIVPHTVRLFFGSSYRRILPLSLCFGGGFLVLCDLLARSVLAPAEVPIGVVTAFLGAPFFLVVLRQSRRLG
jgi:iron complex transport system permease protein